MPNILGLGKYIRLKQLLKFLERNPKFKNIDKVELPELVHWDSILRKELNRNKEVENIAIYDKLVYILVAVFTIILYAHKLFPVGVKEFLIFGIEFATLGFDDFSVFIWVLALKVSLLGLMTIWFLTSKSWWRLAILSPIAVSIYQLWEIISNSNDDIDIAYFSKSLPIMTIILGVLLYTSKNVDYANKLLAFQKGIEEKVEELIMERYKKK